VSIFFRSTPALSSFMSVRVGIFTLMAAAGGGFAAAATKKPHWASCRGTDEPPAPFESWDEVVMSSAPPWRRGWDKDWDGRHPKDAGVEMRGKARHLLLIRHGQYDLDNKSHDLTELGRKQSHITGQYLSALATGVRKDHYGESRVKYDAVVSSTLSRAKQSADIICQSLPGVERLEDDPLLQEGCPCVPMPGNREEFLERTRPSRVLTQSVSVEAAFRKYFHRDKDFKRKSKSQAKAKDSDVSKIPVGTTAMAQGPDAKADELPQEAGSKVNMEPEHTVLVCHNNIIRYFVCRALQLPPEAWLRLKGDNCAITEIVVYPNGRVSLHRFGDTGHLPIDMQTYH